MSDNRGHLEFSNLEELIVGSVEISIYNISILHPDFKKFSNLEELTVGSVEISTIF